MLGAIARFEVRYQLRQPLFWLTAAMFFFMVFGATTTDSIRIGGAIGNVHRNAPFVVVQMLGVMSVIGLFIVVAFMAGAALRDFERGTHELVFSRPIRTRDFLLGRFLGSLLVSCLCFAFAALGSIVGGFMPWLDPSQLGPTDLRPHLWTMLVLIVPNFLTFGAAFFFLASKTRSMMSTYLGLVGFFAFYFVASSMSSDVENLRSASLLDPFGVNAIDFATRYWTVVEKNGEVPALSGDLLWNRLLWIAVGVGALAVMTSRFRYDKATAPRKSLLAWRRKGAVEESAPRPALTRGSSPARPTGPGVGLVQLAHQLRLEVRATIKSAPFIVILAFGIFNVVGGASFIDMMFGTSVWPVTHLMLAAIQGGYSFLLAIILTFYAGEMVYRERSAKMDGIVDALPVPTWVPFTAKLAGLCLVVCLFLVGGSLSMMTFQLYEGYTHLEPALWLKGFVVQVTPFLIMSVLALFLQVVSGSKFTGYLLMILFMIDEVVLNRLHFDHNLYRFGSTPDAPYSDMNGYGHFVAPLLWFTLYWGLAAAILGCLASLFWFTGPDASWRERLLVARRRLGTPMKAGLASLLAAFVATGAFIYRNTNVLNEYIPSDEAEERAAHYEKTYAKYKDLPQPRITAVEADVDIFPAERRLELRGTYTLVNKTGTPIPALHVLVPRRVKINKLEMPAHTVELDDRKYGYAIYTLAEPLAPGAEATLAFDLTVANPGFVNNGSNTQIVENGTSFNNRDYMPSLGYQTGGELQDPTERRRQGLEPLVRMPKIDDAAALRNTYIANDADWVRYETTVSTSPDQIAIASGYLQKEWTENGRRYFRYEMDAPILNLWGYLSARYEVRKDVWKASSTAAGPPGEDVAIEVYYHPGHEYNVERMIHGVKKSLDYLTAQFSPYQHRQVRIVEFPRYARFAQSLPNTIPFSESIGFIARLDESDPEAIDYPFYVTAHEVAHQWWAHQVIGGNVQGSTMLSETMAQYSALQIMKHEYGEERMARFLKYELDRYLRDRGGELLEEQPLQLVENQPYIHYRKGSVVTYALQDSIGEEKLNGAIRSYLERVAFQQPPYTTSLEMLAEIRAVAGPEHQKLVDDLFANITLYKNEAVSATYRALPDGRYEVTLEAKAAKVTADGQGAETDVPVDDDIEVGVYGEREVGGKKEPKLLYLAKHRVNEATPRFTVTVEELPVKAGIDPLHKLVDRSPDDNVKSVTAAS